MQTAWNNSCGSNYSQCMYCYDQGQCSHHMGTNLRKDLYVTQAYSAFRGRWGACIGVQDCKLCVLKTANACMYGNIRTVHCYGLHLAFLKLENCMCYLYYIVMYDNCVHTSKA